MHPVIMRQLAADHISETHARAEDERRARPARRARRRTPVIRLSGVVAGVLSVVHAFGDLRPPPVRHGDGLHDNGGALEGGESTHSAQNLPKRESRNACAVVDV